MTRNQIISLILGLLLGFLLGLWLFYGTEPVEGKAAPSCKHENAECKTNESDKLCCEGLICMDKGVPSDNGKCQVIPTATPVPPTATPTPKECKRKCTPTPTPTIEPTVTPSPIIEPSPVVTESPKTAVTEQSGSTMPSAPLCQDTIPYKVTDFWIENPVSGDNALTLRWGTSQDWNTVNIAYGENKYEWKYALLGTEDDGEEVIGGLNNGTHYWFQIAYTNGCAVGEYSNPIDPTP